MTDDLKSFIEANKQYLDTPEPKKDTGLIPKKYRDIIGKLGDQAIHSVGSTMGGPELGYGLESYSRNHPTQTKAVLATLAGLAAPETIPILGEGLLSSVVGGALSGGALAGGQSALEGKSGAGVAKDAGLGALFGGGTPLALKGAGKILAPAAKHAYSGVMGTMSGVGHGDTLRALEQELAGKSIFNIGDKTENQLATELSNKALAGSSKLRSESGKVVGDMRTGFKTNKDALAHKFAPEPALNDLNEFIESRIGSQGGTSLEKLQVKDLKKARSLLNNAKGKPLDEADIVKQSLDDEIAKRTDIFGKMDPIGATFAKMRSKIAQQINEKAPEFATALAKNAEDIQNDQELVRLFGKNELRGSRLFTKISQDRPSRGILESLDRKLLPDEKFMDSAKDLLARRNFQPMFAGKGGGFGSAEGAANLARHQVASAAGKVGGAPLEGIVRTMQMPKVNEYMIKGIGKAANMPGNKSVAMGNLMTQLMRNKDEQ